MLDNTNLFDVFFNTEPLTVKFKITTPEDLCTIKRVIFNGPATIIIWDNGDKTVVKCQNGDAYDKRTGFMYACAKRICEIGGFANPSKNNPKPFDSWMDAWVDRKAENHNK